MRKALTFLLLASTNFSLIAPIVHMSLRDSYGQRVVRVDSDGQEGDGKGLVFNLREGEEGAEKREKRGASQSDPLSQGETGSLLGRLPGIKTDPEDQTEFRKREGSLPAPKTGNVNSQKFPAEGQRPQPAPSGGGLEVLRYSPEGAVSLAPDLTVTFSQPMVAVTSQDAAAQYAPVEMTPQVPGKWRWLGTKTLMFDTTTRFPMATVFKMRIPAGTKSANGQALAKDVTWSFTTPPPSVDSVFPDSQVTARDQLMFVSFDQDVNAQAVLPFIRVTAGGKQIAIRLATDDEVKAEKRLSYYISAAKAKRWIAFRAVNADGTTANALPAASSIDVTVGKGLPSAEGPLASTGTRSFSFNTYGAMKFVNSGCGYIGNKVCNPDDSFVFFFSNQIDGESFDPSLVKVEPPVSGAKIYASGNYVYVGGAKRSRTAYKVTVGGELKDNFGQALGDPVSATFNVGAMEPGLYSSGKSFIVLDPAVAARTYSVFTVNTKSVRVRLRAVTPSDWEAFRANQRFEYYDSQKRPPLPGRIVFDQRLAIAMKQDEMVETKIDLSKALPGGLGNVIVEVSEDFTVRPRGADVTTWVQSTRIGLDAFVDNEELVGFATDLLTGKPLAGVELSIGPNGRKAESKTVSENASYFGWFWNWISSFGVTDDSIRALDENGTVETETIEAQRGDVTGANGILRLPLPEKGSNAQNMLIAKSGADTAFMPEDAESFWGEGGRWYVKKGSDEFRWFVFDDRGLYKPKEEVSLKGYLRKITAGGFGDVESIGYGLSKVYYRVADSRGNVVLKGEANLNAFGAFDFKFTLPDNFNLGSANVMIGRTPTDTEFSHAFQVEEFRRPEFEVNAKVDSEGPFFIGDTADLSVEAKYYAGGGLADAKANWTVNAKPTNYTPPNRDDYTFGTWIPWWRSSEDNSSGKTQTFEGVTDAAGKHRLKIDFAAANPARPYTVSASASVQDVNRQTFASQTSLLVHPSSLYVGIKTPRTFVQKGEKISVDSIVTDIDGNLVANRDVAMKASLKDWQFVRGGWKQVVIDEQTCTVKSLGEGAAKCEFVAKAGGVYTVSANVLDDRERRNESELTVWVPGGSVVPNRDIKQEESQVIPDKKEYAPGDVAEILVTSPFGPAEGVLTLRRDGIVKTERFTMKGDSITLKIRIDDRYLPNIFAQVDLVGAAQRMNDAGEADPKLAKRPAFASGQIELKVSTASRKVSVTATPESTAVEPGGTTKVAVEVKDNSGNPVSGSEVALVVVDESVLALTDYAIADPTSVFYTSRSGGVSDYHLRGDVLLVDPNDLKSSGGVSGVGRGAGDSAPRVMRKSVPMPAPMAMEAAVIETSSSTVAGAEPIKVRSNFNALAVFAPSVRTDSNGRAVVEVKLPDNLTRYRVTAVAVDFAKRFGKGESSITARQPLMVRPSAPRFMNFGDRIELPVVVQNQTDKDMAVDVAVRASNATLTDGAGRRVLVKANDRAEVRFPVAAEKAGTARFQFAVSSGKWTDAAEIELPVWTPATSEAFATYGTFDSGPAVFQPIQAPADVYPQFGGVEVTTSSTQLQELTDSFIYLYKYPFECTEQVSSRMISIAALRDVLSAFKSKDMPTKEQLEKSYAKDIDILKGRQRDDGSFGLWSKKRERYEYPFLTVHSAHALALAEAKGYEVPDSMIKKVRPYLANIESKLDENHRMSPQTRWTISAYALYVRNLLGDRDAAKAKKLLAEVGIENMPFEALGWIMSVLAEDKNSAAEVQAIERFLMNRTTETASTANFVTDYGDGAYLIMYSSRRADGVLLEALLKADAKNDLVPKLVRGLLDQRNKGAWANTQENVFILLALDKYFEAYEKVTPDFVTRVWLGDAYAGEQTFKGRSADSNLLSIPMSYLLQQGGASNLIIDRQGVGRLYYRIGMKYAPKNLKLDAADYGFTVLRTYEAVDDPADVVRNADGSWTFKAGARVRVKITMVADSRRYHVALVDPLPAGLEILNPALAVTEALPAEKSSGGGSWWRRYWYEHQNLRDERAEAFASIVWGGVYDYSYVARATTPGVFVVPPAKAEEMYHPETFGRTATDFVTVR